MYCRLSRVLTYGRIVSPSFNCFESFNEVFWPFFYSALFQSLLFEACGRTVNPVNGAVGLLWTGNWNACQSAVETVLGGGALLPISRSPAKESEGNIDLFGSQDHLHFSRGQNNGQELTTARQDLSAMNTKSASGTATRPAEVSKFASEFAQLRTGSAQRMRGIEREQMCMETTWEGRYFCGIRFGTRKKTRPSTIKVISYVPVAEPEGLGAGEGSVIT